MSDNFPKHILQICRLTPLWGMDLFREITQAFHTPEYQVTTVFLSGGENPELRKTYYGKVLFWQLNRRGMFWRWQAFWKILRLCRQHYFTAVICHHYKPTVIMQWTSLFCRVGKLFSMHHNFGNFRRRSARWMAQWLKRRWQFITVSNALKKELIAVGIPAKHIVTIHNTIDIETVRARQLTRPTARQALNLPENAVIFGTLGRLVRGKGQIFLLQAFAQLRLANTLLVLIGDGPEKALLQEQAKKSGIAAQVHFVTEQAQHGADYLRALDIFVFPSLKEAFGLALLEAMAAELPIIASNVGGIPEAVGKYGLLVLPQNSHALAEAMHTLYTLPENERKQLGMAAYQQLCERFNLENYYQAFRDVVSK